MERSYLRGSLQEARLDITKHTREELQRKSRYFEKNSSLYNKLADLWEQYVTGTGLQFYATTTKTEWNTIADRAWEQWKPFADISSRFGFDNLQGIAVRSLFVDGEVFVLLTRDPANNRPRIQLIEAHRCKTPDAMQKQEGVSIVDGIEVDQSGRPIAYWFAFGEKEMRRFDAFAIVHIFEPARPGQMRGIPYISCALNILHDLDDLQILEMRHKKVVSENSLNVFTATGDLPPGMNAATGRFRDVAGATASGATTTEKRLEYYKSAYGGRVNVAMHGDKIEEQTSDRPNVATRDYWRMLEEKVCCATGVPLVIALPDSMQGTVYRGSLDAANAFFRCKTSVLATYFKRIREYVLNMEGSFFPPLGNRPADWQSCDYLPPAAVNTDIGYNSAANINELTAGLKSWDDILLPQGRKAEPVLRRKAELQLYIKRLAATLSANPEGITISAEEIASLDLSAPVAATETGEGGDAPASLVDDMNAYGIGVRAGAFTPTPDDEDYFRNRANLPKLSAEARDSWSQENNVRRPITLVKPGDPQKESDAAALAETQTEDIHLQKSPESLTYSQAPRSSWLKAR